MGKARSIRRDADRIREILAEIQGRQDPRWHRDDYRAMEQLLAAALGAEALGGGHAGDMVLTGVVELPKVGAVRYIIDAKMDTTGRGRAETDSSGVRHKLAELVSATERVIHATLWVNANGRVKAAGLFRFYEGFRTVRWRRMESLTEVTDMNELARAEKLRPFREEVLARLRQTNLKTYREHVAEVARRFTAAGVADAVLGCKAVEIWESEEGAEQLRQEAAARVLGAKNPREGATRILGAKDPQEAAAQLLGISVEELRQRLKEKPQ